MNVNQNLLDSVSVYSGIDIGYKYNETELNSSSSSFHYTVDRELILMTMLRFDTIVPSSSTLSIIYIDPKEGWAPATADTTFFLLITLMALKRVEDR